MKMSKSKKIFLSALKKPLISIVIRTYNEEKFLNSCLKRIKAQKILFDYEVIVVDSGSSDGTLSIANENGCLLVYIKKCDFTFGHSLNMGISVASGSVIVVLSAHCLPRGVFWLSKLISPILSGKFQLSFGSHEADISARSSEYIFFRRKYSLITRLGNMADHFNNGNSAFLRSLWNDFPFDSSATAQEDVVFARAHVKRGGNIIYIPSARVIHCHNYSNYALMKRVALDSEANARLSLHSGLNLSYTAKNFILSIYDDLLLARGRGKLLKALPGIITFRVIQVLSGGFGHLKGRLFRG